MDTVVNEEAIPQNVEVVISRKKRNRELRQKLWEEKKEERRAIRLEKRKVDRARRKTLISQGVIKRRVRKLKDQKSSGIAVIIDNSFEDKMTEKEISSTAFQVSQCYSINRTSQKCFDLIVSGHSGKFKECLSSRFPTYKSWKAHFTDVNYKDAYAAWVCDKSENQAGTAPDNSKLIYLTPDSPNVLKDLQKEHAYVIGGLTDRNRYKFLCLEKAEGESLATARLPIDEHIHIKSRKVLSIDIVFGTLSKFLNSNDWNSALLESIPSRKNATKKAHSPSTK